MDFRCTTYLPSSQRIWVTPNGKLKTVVMIIQANKQGDIGKASALCVIIFVVSAVIGLALMFASADHDGKKKKKKRG